MSAPAEIILEKLHVVSQENGLIKQVPARAITPAPVAQQSNAKGKFRSYPDLKSFTDAAEAAGRALRAAIKP